MILKQLIFVFLTLASATSFGLGFRTSSSVCDTQPLVSLDTSLLGSQSIAFSKLVVNGIFDYQKHEPITVTALPNGEYVLNSDADLGPGVHFQNAKLQICKLRGSVVAVIDGYLMEVRVKSKTVFFSPYLGEGDSLNTNFYRRFLGRLELLKKWNTDVNANLSVTTIEANYRLTDINIENRSSLATEAILDSLIFFVEDPKWRPDLWFQFAIGDTSATAVPKL